MAGPPDWNPSAEPYVDYLLREYPNGSPRQYADTAPADGADGAPAPAPAAAPTSALGADPAYQAFKSALGLQEDTASRNTQSQTDALNQSLATRLPQIAQTGVLQRQKVAGSMESRGLLNSGETEQNLANQRSAEAQQVSGLQDTTAQRVAALQQSLADRMQGFNMQDVGQQQAALQRQYLAQQQAAINAALASGTPILPGGGLSPLASSGDVNGVITSTAQSLGVDPRLALAVAQQESGYDPTATGDNGSSFGLYQLHQGGELGSLTQAQAFDPATNAQVALAQIAAVAAQHPDWSPGQIAAAAQRPADPTGYANAINSIYAGLGG